VRGENALRVAFLFPCSASFIVTGLIWQWLMNPMLGIQHTIREWGWTSFTFDWASRPGTALLAVSVAGVWQAAGMVMAILLASLRRIDGDIWHAARIDGIPAHRVYRSIIIPQLAPTMASLAVIQLVGVVKVYDLVVALTQGGPGTASDMPTLYVMDYLFVRQNVGLASAASVFMLTTVCAVAAPVYYARARRGAAARKASS
jgi:glucose/mannose transport system permease protein